MEYFRVYDVSKTYTFASGASTASLTHAWEGKIMQLHLRAPTFSGAAGYTLSLRNGDGFTIYTAPSCGSAANANVYLGASAIYVPSNDLTTSRLVLGGTPTSGGTVEVIYKIFGVLG